MDLGLLEKRQVTVIVRIALGVIFIVASLPKIADPPSFAQMIYNYRLVPSTLVNVVALVLPWLELLCGVALVFGIWQRSAAAILGVMLAAFVVAISVNVLRLNPLDCGCFNPAAAGRSPAQQMLDMLWVIVRDFAMLAMVAQILLGTREPAPRS